jgi:hypothetical protein
LGKLKLVVNFLWAPQLLVKLEATQLECQDWRKTSEPQLQSEKHLELAKNSKLQ